MSAFHWKKQLSTIVPKTRGKKTGKTSIWCEWSPLSSTCMYASQHRSDNSGTSFFFLSRFHGVGIKFDSMVLKSRLILWCWNQDGFYGVFLDIWKSLLVPSCFLRPRRTLASTVQNRFLTPSCPLGHLLCCHQLVRFLLHLHL